MVDIKKEDVIAALKDVIDPEIGQSIVDLNMVKDVEIKDHDVAINVNLTVAGCPMHSKIGGDIENRIKRIKGVNNVNVKFSVMTPEERQSFLEKINPPTDDRFNDTRIIVIGSGKGGVGKSTVSANLAITLSKKGYKVGLIDADILGFSITRMMNIVGKKPVILDEHNILPLKSYGVEVISMGAFVDENTPIIWRGPMLAGAIEQFLYDVNWGKLDYLLLDLPPGTGDIPLTIMQKLPKSQLLLVTTPQAVSSHVAERLAIMAEKTQTEILGIIENMSYFICDNCGKKHYIFGKGDTDRLSEELSADILGNIPIDAEISEQSDIGKPIAALDNDISKIYLEIAKKIIAK